MLIINYILILISITFGFGFFNPSASAQIIETNPWDTKSKAGWIFTGTSTIDVTTNTPDPVNALRFIHPLGYSSGSGVEGVAEYNISPNIDEVYYGHWFKLSNPYDWQGTGQKVTTIVINEGGNSGTIILTIMRVSDANHPQKLHILNQGNYGPSSNVFSNVGPNPTIQIGIWYWVEVRLKMNTPGVTDGLAQVWINGNLHIDRSDIGYRSTGCPTCQWSYLKHTPIWGSGTDNLTKNLTDYFWIDYTVISTQPIGMPGGPPPDTIPPVPPLGLVVQ